MADAVSKHLKSKLASDLKKQHADRVDVPEDRQFVGFDAYKKAIALADVVILATPPGIRPIHLEEAVNAGKNIFSEKPLAVDGPGIRKGAGRGSNFQAEEPEGGRRPATAS